MSMKSGFLIAAFLAVLAFVNISSAALLGVMPAPPQIVFDNVGTTKYDASSDVLSIDARPIVIRLSAEDPPILITPTSESGEMLAITIVVDDGGALVGGNPDPPGNDLVVIGQVDLGTLGFFSGVLLTGEVVEFGFNDSGVSTDHYDFRFTVTGGQLAFLYEGQDIGVFVESTQSDFSGDFSISFHGEAKGTLGSVPAVLAALGDFVWHDLNGDGIQDDGEPGVDGVTVTLYECGDDGLCGTGDDIFVATTTTDSNGKYLFQDLTPGDYCLEFMLPDGFTFTLQDQANDDAKDSDADPFTGKTICITLETGEVDLTWDTGVVQEKECLIEVHKTCCVPAPPVPGADDCQGKVIRMDLEYTGDDCSATTNDQEGSAECSGDPASTAPVSIIYTGKDPDKITVSPDSGIMVGDTFSIVATGRAELHADTKLEISDNTGVLQSLKIHTSCSKALNVGDQFGSMKVVELETTEGGIATLDLNPDEGTACLPPDFPEGTPCDSRLIEAVFEYTGLGCEPLLNPQDGKAACAGDPAGKEPVSIVYTGKDPDKITVSPASGIKVGDTVRITATGRDELHADTSLQISDDTGVLQSLKIHTSCSQPLALGDEFGSLRLVEFTTKDGGTKAIADPNVPIFLQECVVPAAPPEPHCTSRVRALTIRYLGGACSESLHTQGDKAQCSGEDPVADVSITFTKDADKFSTTPNSGISIGDMFTIAKNDGGDFPSEIKFDATGTGGTQSLMIHTSCSQPLNLGDQFGAFGVFSMDLKDEGIVSLGGQIEYQYTITNIGSDVVEVTSVFDDTLGEIADGSFTLDPGNSQTLFKTASILEDTTNEVTVKANVNGQPCKAKDILKVTVVEPPPGPFTCDKPIDALTMIWNGTQNIRVKAWKGNVGSTLLAEIDGVMPGDEVTISGFAGSPNDIIWEIFEPLPSTTKIGESTFHLSCSDENMNGAEDCGKAQGDGKEKSGFINTWILEGMVDASGTLDCTP